MPLKELNLNVLNFQPAIQQLTVWVGTTATNDFIKLAKGDCIALKDQFDEAEELFCNFQPPTETSKEITRAVSYLYSKKDEQPWTRTFMKKYYTHFLTKYFRSIGIPAENNFVSDTTVWIKTASPYNQCDGFREFTLRVGFNAGDAQPELLVAMGDVRSVYTKPLNNAVFSEISKKLYSRVLFRNRIYWANDMPDIVSRHLDEAYPFVSFEMLNQFNIARPAPEKGNRYLKYKAEIEAFRTKYLENKALENLMQISTEWKEMTPN